MSRQGLCHCGEILQFHRGPSGYKQRCPRCGAVVRLRKHSATPVPPPHRPMPLPAAPRPNLDVELMPVPALPPTPLPIQWFWVALAGAVSLLGILVLIWLLRW